MSIVQFSNGVAKKYKNIMGASRFSLLNYYSEFKNSYLGNKSRLL
jgi:hypothetical protein